MGRRSATRAIAIGCGLLVALVFILFNIRISTDLSLFLPDPESKVDRLLHDQLDSGASSSLIFIALENLPAEDLARLNKAFAARLKASGSFGKVLNSTGELGEDELEFVVRHRYQLSHGDLATRFSADGLSQAIDDRLRGLASPEAVLEKRFLRFDPTGEVIALLEEWQGKLSRHKTPTEAYGVWFSENLERTLLLTEIRGSVTELENQGNTVNLIRDIYDDLREPGLNMIMTGPAVFAVESGEDIRADVKVLSYLAFFLVVAFLWSVYRSFRAVLLVVSPLLMGIVVATATILLIKGHVHGITLAFGITLAGVAVDYPIHLLTGMTGDRAENESHVARIWPTLRLGVMSTVIAFAAFLISGFDGLQQLGLFTTVGLLAAAAFSRWVLPWLTARRTRKQGLAGVQRILRTLGQRAPACRWMVPTLLGVMLAALALSPRSILHLNVDSLSPINQERRAEGKMLRDDLGFWFGGSMLILTASDEEAVLQLSETLQPDLDGLIAEGVIEGYDMASQFLPSKRRQRASLDVLDDAAGIRKRLTAALADRPFKEGVFDPFLEDIDGLDGLPLIGTAELAGTSTSSRLKPLLFEFEGEAAGVVLLHGVTDEAAMERLTDRYEGAYYLHLKTAATNLVARSVDRVALVMAGCVLLIYLFLAKSFASFSRPLKVMVPTFAAAVTVAGILVFSGNPLSIFHLISLLLVVGLGLDYALFFNRLPENGQEWDTTFKSLWICAVTTVLVFGILTFSQTPPLRAIGLTVGIGALISFVFAAMWATAPEKMAAGNHEAPAS